MNYYVAACGECFCSAQEGRTHERYCSECAGEIKKEEDDWHYEDEPEEIE